MRTVKVIELTKDIKHEDYPKPIQDALDEMFLFWSEFALGIQREKIESFLVKQDWDEDDGFNFFELIGGDKMSLEQLIGIANFVFWYVNNRAKKENKTIEHNPNETEEIYLSLE